MIIPTPTFTLLSSPFTEETRRKGYKLFSIGQGGQQMAQFLLYILLRFHRIRDFGD
jgi:hypothetical protein